VNQLFGPARLGDVAVFTRELSVLVSTGTPIAEALHALERQAKDEEWRAVVASLRSQVEEGASLSSAMETHSRCFDPVCQSLVGAGEASGELDTMLSRLAALIRQQQNVRSATIGALAYPSALLLLSTAAVVVMLLTVVPRFAGMFESLDAELPATTELLVMAGQGVGQTRTAPSPRRSMPGACE